MDLLLFVLIQILTSVLLLFIIYLEEINKFEETTRYY